MRRQRLAAPFLVTIAASACNAPTAPGVAADADIRAAPIRSDDVPQAASPSLPPAPSAGVIERLDGGVCIWRAPPLPSMMRIRNPPAPHQVECPDAGTP